MHTSSAAPATAYIKSAIYHLGGDSRYGIVDSAKASMRENVISAQGTSRPAMIRTSKTALTRDKGVLAARGISRVFTRQESALVALEGVDLELSRGQFVALVGPSGCGKSTLLRIMAGLLPPTAGQIEIDGTPVTTTRPDVALMFQEATLLPWRNVLANILLPIEIRRKVLPQDRRKVERMLEMVQLSRFANHYPSELSGGMQQRVALSRTLITDPTLMLLDEPFGALDEFTREALNIELARIVENDGRTVVLVTHNISEAVFLADRVVAMGTDPGRILGEVSVPFKRPRGTTVMQEPDFVRLVGDVRRLLGMA